VCTERPMYEEIQQPGPHIFPLKNFITKTSVITYMKRGTGRNIYFFFWGEGGRFLP